MNRKLIGVTFLLFLSLEVLALENSNLKAMVDLHTHLASHIPYGFMLRGGTPNDTPDAKAITTEHTFWQQMYVDWIKASGIKLIVNAALINVFQFSKVSARDQVLAQLNYSHQFIAKHPDLFFQAKTPSEAKIKLAEGKIVFVDALEGAEDLIETEDDVIFWRNQGVSMIAPIHLCDSEYGSASILEGVKRFLNPTGLWKRWIKQEEQGGLTPHGKNVVRWILKHGMVIDLAHMSHKSTADTIEIAEELKLSTVVSHTSLLSVHLDERGLSDEMVKRIYNGGGLIGLTSGRGLIHPNLGQTLPADYCRDSIDDYFFQYEYFQKKFSQYPLGFGSDFNGFVTHMKACPESIQTKTMHPLKKYGLRSMKELPIVLDYLEQKLPKSTETLMSSAERYLEIWEKGQN